MSDKNSPFDYINSIFYKSKKDDLNGYVSFIVNRGLSYHSDCVYYANEMNRFYDSLQPDQQYEFLYSTIKKGKRPFQKWSKQQKDDDIELLQEYYKCNRQRAIEILTIINNDVIEVIRDKMHKGGKTK